MIGWQFFAGVPQQYINKEPAVVVLHNRAVEKQMDITGRYDMNDGFRRYVAAGVN